MARLVTMGWESGTWEQDGGRVAPAGTTHQVQSSVRRTGTYAMRCETGTVDNSIYIVQTLPEAAEIYFRIAVYHTMPGSDDAEYCKFLSFHEGGQEHVSIAVSREDLSFNLYVLGSIVDRFYVAFRTSTWYVLEGHVLIANSGGSITIKVNGTTALTYTGDTCATSSEFISNIRVGGQNIQGLSKAVYIDDLAINDTSGSYQNSWVGLGGVFYLEPTADGDQNDWTPSAGSDNYAMVDDIPPDNATTYNQGLNAAEIELYEVDDCPTYINVINLVEVVYRAALATSGYNELTDLVKVSGSVYQGLEYVIVPITPSFTYYKGTQHYINPYTGSVWGTAEVNATQAGVEITV